MSPVLQAEGHHLLQLGQMAIILVPWNIFLKDYQALTLGSPYAEQQTRAPVLDSGYCVTRPSPFLQAEADPLQEQLRQMAISLLCGMVHSTWNTRMALWNCNGLTTLLELLKEEATPPPHIPHPMHRCKTNIPQSGSGRQAPLGASRQHSCPPSFCVLHSADRRPQSALGQELSR